MWPYDSPNIFFHSYLFAASGWQHLFKCLNIAHKYNEFAKYGASKRRITSYSVLPYILG